VPFGQTAATEHMGFAVSTLGGLISFVITLFFSPATKGKILVTGLQNIPAE
jgi:ascorbate-specific PTS system EIIC-type component UlaA